MIWNGNLMQHSNMNCIYLLIYFIELFAYAISNYKDILFSCTAFLSRIKLFLNLYFSGFAFSLKVHSWSLFFNFFLP